VRGELSQWGESSCANAIQGRGGSKKKVSVVDLGEKKGRGGGVAGCLLTLQNSMLKLDVGEGGSGDKCLHLRPTAWGFLPTPPL